MTVEPSPAAAPGHATPAQQTTVTQPTSPDVVNVPSYNPTVFYGGWPYLAYPPAYPYPPGYRADGGDWQEASRPLRTGAFSRRNKRPMSSAAKTSPAGCRRRRAAARRDRAPAA